MRVFNNLASNSYLENIFVCKEWLESIIQDEKVGLTQKLIMLVRLDERISMPDRTALSIDAQQGHVSIGGCVQDPLSMEYALKDVLSLDEVVEVDNHINVKQVI